MIVRSRTMSMKLNDSQALQPIVDARRPRRTSDSIIRRVDAEPAEDEHDQEEHDRRYRRDHLPPPESRCVHSLSSRLRWPDGPSGSRASVYRDPAESADRAARTVFARSIAIVIGPTPPGTGRDRSGDLGRRRRSRRRRRGPSSVRFMPTSMTVAPGLTQLASTISRPADGGDEHVGAAADGGEVAGARVAGR